jgi:hypothetical protein
LLAKEEEIWQSGQPAGESLPGTEGVAGRDSFFLVAPAPADGREMIRSGVGAIPCRKSAYFFAIHGTELISLQQVCATLQTMK